jgi:hypothetical protein
MKPALCNCVFLLFDHLKAELNFNSLIISTYLFFLPLKDITNWNRNILLNVRVKFSPGWSLNIFLNNLYGKS